MLFNLIVIGGGAGGFFAALAAKESHPNANVLLLEKSAVLLAKVRVSGGGRCNVTHACFDPIPLSQNYPRGGKALIGPFTRFQPRDTIQWFESRGVMLKTEADGRMFPITDSSQTIIDCLMNEAKKLNVEIRLKQNIQQIQKTGDHFTLTLANGDTLECERLILATGSHPQGHALAQTLGHSIIPPVPSLFTFNIPDSPLVDLSGISVNPVSVQLVGSSFKQMGPLLITHWGFSGPAVLKLSAWAARRLHARNYHAEVSINWLATLPKKEVLDLLQKARLEFPGKSLTSQYPFDLPKNLWKRLIELTGIDSQKRLSDIDNESLSRLCDRLTNDVYQVDGKTTYKEEFVTCGGVTLDEVNFKTMESRLCPGLYFAGEILDVDAITGGFNFQNAWTTGWIAGISEV